MFEWLFGKRNKTFEEETKRAFSEVRDDMNKVGKWLKHLDGQDKQLFETISELKQGLSTIKEDILRLREQALEGDGLLEGKQVFKKLPVFGKQTAVEPVEIGVQTPVQTGNIYEILKGLSANERLLIFTLMNAEEGMKLSYEDLAMLLGKERATIRGQVNTIKQKSFGLIEEIVEKNGKKRVYVPAEIKEKLSKYAKVRVKGVKK
jgi:hypothetical protein